MPAPEVVAGYRAAPMFAISLGKLAVMSVCTFGIYEWYWFLKHWDAERRRESEHLSPVVRALFAPCFAFSLFRRLKHRVAKLGGQATWPAFGLGLAYLILGLGRVVPLGAWLSLASGLSFVPLLIVQHSANAINREVVPELPPNGKYSAAELALLAAGIAFQVVIVLLLRQLTELSEILDSM